MTGRTRVQASCTCGDSWDVPERAWDWVSEKHAQAHNKGRDGLTAAGAFTVTRYPEASAAGGYAVLNAQADAGVSADRIDASAHQGGGAGRQPEQDREAGS